MSVELFVTDTETASLKGGVCDIAIIKLDENLNILWQAESLIDPECQISPDAMGIHHITNQMVVNEPTLSEFMEMHRYPFDVANPIIAGHNIAFDVRMIGKHIPAVHTRLCTLKLARVLWPDAENHKLQTLRYKFDLDAGTAHRAMGDVMTCHSLMKKVCQEYEIGLLGLLALVKRTLSLDSKMSFGKHKDEKLSDLPLPYVRWLLDKADIDPDLREALATRLK